MSFIFADNPGADIHLYWHQAAAAIRGRAHVCKMGPDSGHGPVAAIPCGTRVYSRRLLSEGLRDIFVFDIRWNLSHYNMPFKQTQISHDGHNAGGYFGDMPFSYMAACSWA